MSVCVEREREGRHRDRDLGEGGEEEKGRGRNGKDRNEDYASNKEIWTEGSFMKVKLEGRDNDGNYKPHCCL